MKIGVSSYSFKNISHADAIVKAKELGYAAIELTDIGGETQDERIACANRLRETAKQAGIEISAYVAHADLAGKDTAAEVKRVCGQVDIASALGTKNFRHDVMWSYDVYRSFDAALPVIAAAAREIAVYAETKGIRTMSENHGFIVQDSYRMEKLVAAVAHHNYGLLVDVGNFLCADENPVSAVSRVANLASLVHVKDFYAIPFGKNEGESVGFMTRGANRLKGATIGHGVVPIAQCLAILKKAGYDGFVDVEFEGESDCIEALAESLATLRAYI